MNERELKKSVFKEKLKAYQPYKLEGCKVNAYIPFSNSYGNGHIIVFDEDKLLFQIISYDEQMEEDGKDPYRLESLSENRFKHMVLNGYFNSSIMKRIYNLGIVDRLRLKAYHDYLKQDKEIEKQKRLEKEERETYERLKNKFEGGQKDE